LAVYILGMAKTQNKNITQQLNELEQIAQWFEKQEQIDVEQGLEKVKQGVALVAELKSRLKSVENEFKQIAKDLE
jgi:exonuclease VII small subunit